MILSATFDEQGRRQLAQLEITLWFSLLGAALISFGGGYLFAGRLLRPIKEIAGEVNDISAKNLVQRIPCWSFQKHQAEKAGLKYSRCE